MSRRAAGDEEIPAFVHAKQPLDGGRIGRVEDLDAAVVYLLSDAARFVTGQVLAIDGGWSVSGGTSSGERALRHRHRRRRDERQGRGRWIRLGARSRARRGWRRASRLRPRAVVRDDLVRHVGHDPAVYGLAAPGIANPDGRSIWWMQGRRDEMQGLDWSSHLETASAVRVLNDAQAALLGEVWQGAARGCRNVLLLTLGTGVGGAAIVDGRLIRGHLGRAGHFGHVSLDPLGSARHRRDARQSRRRHRRLHDRPAKRWAIPIHRRTHRV